MSKEREVSWDTVLLAVDSRWLKKGWQVNRKLGTAAARASLSRWPCLQKQSQKDVENTWNTPVTWCIRTSRDNTRWQGSPVSHPLCSWRTAAVAAWSGGSPPTAWPPHSCRPHSHNCRPLDRHRIAPEPRRPKTTAAPQSLTHKVKYILVTKRKLSSYSTLNISTCKSLRNECKALARGGIVVILLF